MPIDITETQAGEVIDVRFTGTLAKADYERFAAEVEQRVRQHGRIRLLVRLENFHGWSAGAIWEDTKFTAQHFRDLERLAIVGETRWEQGMATFAKPFTTATVRYFDHAALAEARRWVAAAEDAADA